jgi:hypothetical protein
MKSRRYVRADGAVQTALRQLSGTSFPDLSVEMLRLRRDAVGIYVEYDGLPHPLLDLPDGITDTGFVTITDSGTLDRPRAGAYEHGDAIGTVSVYEKATGFGHITEWKLEVAGSDAAFVIALYNGIRDGSIKPKHTYRALLRSVRVRQWVHGMFARWARSGHKQ